MLKSQDNPPILSPLAQDIISLDSMGSWWVAHTLSRFEKAFAGDMLRNGVGYFLPLSDRVTYSSGRKRVSQIPLFPGYVFVCGDDNTRQIALRTNRLCQMLEVSNPETLVAELSKIHQMLECGQQIYPQAAFAAGTRCRVTSGPLEGIEGFVCRSGNSDRLVVNVEMLNRAAAVEIESSLLEKI